MSVSDDKVMTFGEFRRMFRMCPKGHHKGLSSNGPDYCWHCHQEQRKAECAHSGSRYWRNPSNLPGDNRFVCDACGKSGLPPKVEDVEIGFASGKRGK